MSSWLAILGLVTHLLAAGACPLALSSDAAFAASDAPAFPICHTVSVSETDSGRADDPAPAPPHDCPFCAAHGHAALADIPPARTIARVAILVPIAVPTPQSAPRRVSLCVAAAPRGPPAAI